MWSVVDSDNGDQRLALHESVGHFCHALLPLRVPHNGARVIILAVTDLSGSFAPTIVRLLFFLLLILLNDRCFLLLGESWVIFDNTSSLVSVSS